jgi:hypothetical protein
MEKYVVKLVVFNGENFGYWKNRIHNYLLTQGHAIYEIVQEAYMIPAMLDNVTSCKGMITTTRLLILLLLLYVGMCMIGLLT